MPNGGILYLLEDMRELELYGSVCAVVSVCDSMNYILEEADLREVFSRVHEYLEEDGVFIEYGIQVPGSSGRDDDCGKP